MSSETLPLTELIAAAIKVRLNAYVPYSNYHVGAALVGANGQIFTGCNVENAAYPACICAERGALMKAVSEGVQQFTTVVVATENAGAPCGHCRQMLFEFSPDMHVVLVNTSGEIHVDTTLRDLLPHGFGPEHLPRP